jgi:putative ABC transport system ATP-binding protein
VLSDGVDIEVVDVTKRHATTAGVVHALDGVSLTVAAGESLAIMGPSGCGKSTLLGLIAGLDVPTEGWISLADCEISSMTEEDRARVRRHEIGMIFQSDNLLPFLTATETVSLQLSLDDREGANGRSLEILTELGLANEADNLPDQLSGGQRQRVAVARALVHDPRLIVADEPTGSLDPVHAMDVVDLLLGAQRATGATLVLVTHEPTVATRLERSIALRDGRRA